MKLAIVGTGYVGLVAGTCFAEMGNYVTCVDVDESRLDSLRNGIIPVHEPGLDKLVASNCEMGRLIFSSDLAVAMQDSEAVFIWRNFTAPSPRGRTAFRLSASVMRR